MSNTATVLAFDFGASSGRAIRAVYDGQNLNYEEIHRFENIPIEKDGHLCWDVETLLKEIHTAIQKAGTFDSLGFDTWGVDFGLLTVICWQTLFITAMPERMANRNRPLPVCLQKNCMPIPAIKSW